MKRSNNGGRGPQRYLEEGGGPSSYIISSCSAGTASTAYTSTGRSSTSLVAANHMNLNWGLDDGAQTEEEQINRIKNLVQEFSNCSINGGDAKSAVLERWLTELGVGWVLHLPVSDAATAAGKLEHTASGDARRWIQALFEIVDTIRLTTSLFPDRGSMPIICEEGQSKGQAVADGQQFLQLRRVTTKLFRRVTNKLFWINSSGCEEHPDTGSSIICEAVPDQLQFAQFFQETMLKMLAFVDLIAGELLIGSNWLQETYEKLGTLLGVHGALSTALPQIWMSSYSPPSVQVFRIQRHLVSLLAAKQEKMGEAIWSTMEHIWTRMMESIEDSNDSSDTAQGSSDIHRITRSVISYMGFLRTNYSSVAPVVSGAARSGKYEPQNVDIPPLDSMVVEMASCVEEKLVQMSQAFPNHSLGFLFMINNLHYLTEHLPMSCLNFIIPVLTRKIKNYIEYYLQVSWAPVLLCLHISHTPLRFRRYYRSPLTKFDSEFLKVYEVQKFWKVPDPTMREILRRAVIEKVISVLTEYLRDTNTVGTPGSIFSPHELEEMLQELFEG